MEEGVGGAKIWLSVTLLCLNTCSSKSLQATDGGKKVERERERQTAARDCMLLFPDKKKKKKQFEWRAGNQTENEVKDKKTRRPPGPSAMKLSKPPPDGKGGVEGRGREMGRGG